jgi:hypothetical protein
MNVTRCCSPNAQTSPVPFLDPNFAVGSNTVYSPLMGYRNVSAETGQPLRGTYIQYGIDVSGTNSTQSSFFYLVTGAFLDDGSGGLVQAGGFFGTRRASPNSGVSQTHGSLSSQPSTVTLDSNRLPTSATIDQTFYNTDTGQYASPADTLTYHPTFYSQGGVQTQYNFTQTETATSIPGLGSNRPNVTLVGYVGGIMTTLDKTNSPTFLQPDGSGPPGFIIGNTNGAVSDVTIQLNPDANRMQADFNFSRQSGSSPPTGILNTAQIQFGSLDLTKKARGAYVDYDNFGAREAIVQSSAPNALQLGLFDPVMSTNNSSVTNGSAMMVAIRPQDAQTIATGLGGGVTFCQCDYTRWGFWSTTTNRTESSLSLSDFGHMLLWVAGQYPANASDVPLTGIATYAGHIIANVQNNGAQYIDAGNFTNTVNFGTQTGAVSATLDSTNYSGTVGLLADRRNFAGTLTGVDNNTLLSNGRLMDMQGSFFKGVSGPVGEMGGRVAVTGPSYLASGIFVGKQIP